MDHVPGAGHQPQLALRYLTVQALGVEVRIEQGVPHPFKLLVTLLLIGAVPLVTALYQLYFESMRWHDSNV